jgi:TP901 family phage tail tape measure protein
MGLGEQLGLSVIFDGVTAGFDAALAKVKNGMSEVQGLGAKMTGVGSGLMSVGAGLTALTAPIGLALGAGIKTAADFQSVMAEVAARTGIAGDELVKVSDFAKKMGADTAFSASQAAQGLLELIAAGMTTNEAMATLPAVLNAAAASGLDLGTTARQISSIMSTFNVKTKDANKVVDALARAAGASAAEIPDLADGIANVGGVAAKFGLTVEDTAAVLALFAKQGLRGAEAGTQLRSMLLNISRPTKDVQAAWKTLGVSLYTTTGNMRPLNAVMEDLKVKLAGLPIQQQNELLTALGGSYGIVGLTALTSGQSIEQMKKSMSQQASATEVAGAKMGTFNMAMESLKGSVETLMITALTPLIENVLKPLVDQMIPVVNQVTDWAKANPELTATIVKVAGGALLAGPALMILGAIIKGVGVATTALLSPAGLLLGAIIGLVGFMNANYEGGFVKMLNDAIKAADQLRQLVGLYLINSLNDLQVASNKFLADVVTAVQGIGPQIRHMVGSLGIAVIQIANSLISALYQVGQAAGNFLLDKLVTALQLLTLVQTALGDTASARATAEAVLKLSPSNNPPPQIPIPDWMLSYAGARANGGAVSAGRAYMVGERGPELFVPRQSGGIVPNHALGNGGVMYATIVLRGEGFEDHIYQKVALALR